MLIFSKELNEKNKRLKDCLQRLVDIQNGPPLIRDKEEYDEIMKEAVQLLKEK